MQKLQETKVRKSQSRKPTVIEIENVRVGAGHFTVIAGPCALENTEQALATARLVQKAGAKIFRGSIFKPRTSPYSFQGVGPEGVEILRAVKKETRLLLETEILSLEQLQLLHDHVDILRIGSRNMDNYVLLQEVGKTRKPVILKRNMSATLEEFLLAAEYIFSQGNDAVILCERGIRTFETYTRNTLDILAVPALKELTHLPVIVDPSHSSGRASLVSAASKAALAAGADGLMIEVHPNPEKALSDGQQSLDFVEFETLMAEIKKLATLFEKTL
ncbi:MAG: 3-deoxy-7-phosphoheptulonate synthase [bacterium]